VDPGPSARRGRSPRTEDVRWAGARGRSGRRGPAWSGRPQSGGAGTWQRISGPRRRRPRPAAVGNNGSIRAHAVQPAPRGPRAMIICRVADPTGHALLLAGSVSLRTPASAAAGRSMLVRQHAGGHLLPAGSQLGDDVRVPARKVNLLPRVGRHVVEHVEGRAGAEQVSRARAAGRRPFGCARTGPARAAEPRRGGAERGLRRRTETPARAARLRPRRASPSSPG
jgi:hypothetical protein